MTVDEPRNEADTEASAPIPRVAGGGPGAELLERAENDAKSYSIGIRAEGNRFRADCAEFPSMTITGDTPLECTRLAYAGIALTIAAMLDEGLIPPPPATADDEPPLVRQVNFRISDRDRRIIAAASREGGFRSVSDFARFASLRVAKEELSRFEYKFPTD